ncbi:MAG: glutathione S-transferase [Afipia sp. 62-7]|nr:glutathione S-transferase N-terminal domain-containing protein [Afipia sp.]OJU16419.1 MAG: glutathione S-transferase [Afipia sp. 62-7]
MTIDFYAWNTPNGRKISVALEEMGLPYKVHPINISKDEQFSPDFLKISPNNKIPAIVDPEGPHGKPVSVFESGAILLYLGEKTGKFLPKDLAERIPVLEWLMWQMGGFGPMPGQVHHFIALENEQDRRYGLERFSKETRRLYGVLDRRLAEHEFVADKISVADFAIVGWAWRHERHKVPLEDFPNVKRWYETMMARPGVKRGFEVKLG